MSGRRIDLLDQKGKTVISLNVVRENMITRSSTPGGCLHVAIEVDPIKASIKCVDCKADLSPMEWIAQIIEYWEHVARLHESYTRSRKAMELQAQMLERKARCKCDHCGRVTRVRLPRLTYAQLRVVEKAESSHAKD